MSMNFTNITSSFSIENLIYSLKSAIIIALLAILIRFIISRLLTVLFNRGIITLGTRSTIMRFVDVIVILVIITAFLQSLVAPPIVLYTLAIFIALSSVMFFYEIREQKQKNFLYIIKKFFARFFFVLKFWR